MIKLDEEKLLSLFKDFNVLTNIRICLFNDNKQEMMSYPPEKCDFCKLIRQNSVQEQKCKTSDNYAFDKCKSINSQFLYKCHMGLIETATPLSYNDKIIGYIMIGQIADDESQFAKISDSVKKCVQDLTLAKQKYAEIPKISDKKIKAASHILDACVSYLYMKKVISTQNENFTDKINNYINQNICKDLRVDSFCTLLHTSRVELYSLFGQLFNSTVAEYVKTYKLNYAANLLRTTKNTIQKISYLSGFNDYNYFSKLFKKHYKITPKSYKKANA